LECIGRTLTYLSDIQGSPDVPGHWIEIGPSRPFTRIHICELPDGKVESGPRGITLLTDDIRSEYDRLKQKGVRFLYPPKMMEWENGSVSLQILMEMSSILNSQFL